MTDQTTTIVIFGSSGDLTRNKLAPALADLYSKVRLCPEVQIVGMARSEMTQKANRLYYLALAPSLFPPAIIRMGEAGYQAENECWRRVVVEKPFGVDSDTAKELNRLVHSVFAEPLGVKRRSYHA